MVACGYDFINVHSEHSPSIPMIVALSVYGVPGESTFRTRYDFVGGGGDHLDRLHSVVRPLRDAHSIALEDLRRAELEAIPLPPNRTGFN
jgi:hypothetical protein